MGLRAQLVNWTSAHVRQKQLLACEIALQPQKTKAIRRSLGYQLRTQSDLEHPVRSVLMTLPF